MSSESLPPAAASGLTGEAWSGDHARAMSSFKAALVQAAAVGFDIERGLDKVARLAREASEGGAALAVFPEAFLPGVPAGDHLRDCRR